jgi:plastocyanin
MSRLLFPLAALLIPLALLGAAACGGDDDDDSADEAEDAGSEADLEITTTDNEFSTDTLTAPADTEVTLRVNNDGSTLHNSIVPEEEITMDLVEGGESGEVTFTLPAGEYEYRCEAHPTEMIGTLIVE